MDDKEGKIIEDSMHVSGLKAASRAVLFIYSTPLRRVINCREVVGVLREGSKGKGV